MDTSDVKYSGLKHSRPRRRRLFQRLQLAAHRVRTTADRVSKERLGVTAAQLGILFAVQAHPGCAQRDVAGQLLLRESAITRPLSRLVAAGWLRRERVDGRTFALHLTDEGAELLAQARPLVGQLETTLSASFSEAELDVIERFLQAASAAFGDTS